MCVICVAVASILICSVIDKNEYVVFRCFRHHGLYLRSKFNQTNNHVKALSLLRAHNMQHNGHMVKYFQTEKTIEMQLVRPRSLQDVLV